MLSAEHIALESRLVQQLAAVKQRELDYVLGRFQAIALQSGLVVATACQTLVSLDPVSSAGTGFNTWLFFSLGLCSVLSGVYVTIACLYIGNWAPGLALRGPTGSLNRAFDVVMSERDQIHFWFSVSMFSYVLQTIQVVWILNDNHAVQGYEIFCTIQGVLSTVAAIWYLNKMKGRFFRDEEQHNLASQKVNARPAAAQPGRRPTDARVARAQSRLPPPARAPSSAGTELRERPGERPGDPLLTGGEPAAAPRGSVAATRGSSQSVSVANWAVTRLQAAQRGRLGRKEASTKSAKMHDGGGGSAAGNSQPGAKRVSLACDAARPSSSSPPLAHSSSSPAAVGDRRKPRRGSITMIDNPLANTFSHPDVAFGPSRPLAGEESSLNRSSGGLQSFSHVEMSGVLLKRVGTGAEGKQGTWWSNLKSQAGAASVSGGLAMEWQRRFFALRGAELCYWHAEADCVADRPPSAAIDLTCYQVMIDTADPNWGFELRPSYDGAGRRTWYFRALSEDGRLEWARTLVAATYASNRSSRSRSRGASLRSSLKGRRNF